MHRYEEQIFFIAQIKSQLVDLIPGTDAVAGAANSLRALIAIKVCVKLT